MCLTQYSIRLELNWACITKVPFLKILGSQGRGVSPSVATVPLLLVDEGQSALPSAPIVLQGELVLVGEHPKKYADGEPQGPSDEAVGLVHPNGKTDTK